MISRREFVRDVAYAGAAIEIGILASGCASKLEHAPSQGDFVAGTKDRLRRDGLDLTANTGEEEIRDFIDKKTFDDKTWMTNSNLGTLQTPARGPIIVQTDNRGEPVPYTVNGFYYPEPPTNILRFHKEQVDADLAVYIYGTNTTRGIFSSPQNKEILDKFARDYFKNSNRATEKVLHLNFLPYKKGMKPIGIPDREWTSRVEGLDAATLTAPDFSSQHVVINFNKLHAASDHFGFEPRLSIIGSLANENVNMVPRNRRNKTNDVENEAPSTVFDLLSQFDPDVAKKILGPNYFPFVMVLENEMLKLKSISRKQMIDAYLEKQSPRRGFLLAPFQIIFAQLKPVPMEGPKYAHIVYGRQLPIPAVALQQSIPSFTNQTVQSESLISADL